MRLVRRNFVEFAIWGDIPDERSLELSVRTKCFINKFYDLKDCLYTN